MNWKRLDAVRRQAGPLELDLIDHYAAGKISRRRFMHRGAVLGLTVPTMAAVIAACGDDDDDTGGSGDGDGGSSSSDDGSGESAAPTQGGELIAGIQVGDANTGLDPLNMQDLGTYGVLATAFEYLVGLDPAPSWDIAATGLAESWSPNEDASVWTFNLREGVMWHDGTPFTSADVAGTIDRIITAAAGLEGVAEVGSTETPDDLTVVMNLNGPNSNLPYLMSVYNAQSLVTPADYTDGTTLDARATGTGPFKFESFDATTFEAKFVRNDDWWGGTPNLDGLTLKGFESGGTQVAAMVAREIDVIQFFSPVDGAGIFNDDNINVVRPASNNHRQLWFNTQLPEGGPFTDVRVRQAVAYALDRQQMVDVLFEGEGRVANDHPVADTTASFDPDATPQRVRDVDMAKALLNEAGYGDGIDISIEVGDLGESIEAAQIVAQNCAEVGINLTVGVTPNSDFYGEYWCAGASWGAQPDTGGPGRPCGASHPIGLVDYGHRPVPDIYFAKALATDGVWNSSNYANSEFDSLFAQFQASPDIAAQTEVTGKIQQLLHEEVPACYPYFSQFMAAHDTSISNVEFTALGHMYFGNASKA